MLSTGVDFKRLISDNIEEQRASLLEIIDDSNIDEVVKLCSRFKALLQINRSTVLQLYLKNEFVAAGDQPQSELKNLFKKHLKHIRYLTPNDVLDFIMGVCFDPFVAAKNVRLSTNKQKNKYGEYFMNNSFDLFSWTEVIGWKF